MSIKFTPLPSGSWGVRFFEEPAYQAGDTVTVIKANGDAKAVTLVNPEVTSPDGRTVTWSITETRPVGGRAPRSYGARRPPASKPTGQRIDLGDVVIETTLQEIATVGRTPAPVAPAAAVMAVLASAESDAELVRRLLVDGPAYQFQGDLRAAVSS